MPNLSLSVAIGDYDRNRALIDGRVLIDGVDMTGVPPYERPVNMMFQSYALFPHMSVADNVAFGLKQDRVPAPEIARRVGEALELVQLGPMGKRRPHQLSGGMKQRVAIARALINTPSIILADEPTGNLDSKTSHEIMEILGKIHSEGNTVVLVTHEEDISGFAHRIVRLRDGLIESDQKTINLPLF